MKTNAFFFGLLVLVVAAGANVSALEPVENSSEDLFWSSPMTVHDYKKETDLHNVAVTVMALTELEFVRLGDGFVGLISRNKKSPISQSLDSLEYAYSQLPRIEPVRRFGQFWDALQLRQLSLSDARIVGTVLMGNSFGGVTPIMQVRVYKLLVWVEDIIYDLDRTVMFPLNWGVSSVAKKPVELKSLGYAADGLGVFRWQLSAGLKWVSREIVQISSNLVSLAEKPHDAMVRKKRKKQNKDVLIYAKMPLSVFLENQRFLQDKKQTTTVRTPESWQKNLSCASSALPDNIQPSSCDEEDLSSLPSSREVVISVRYAVWENAPRELKKYVITTDELDEIVKSEGSSQEKTSSAS